MKDCICTAPATLLASRLVFSGTSCYRVECGASCGEKTRWYSNKDEAINAWNSAITERKKHMTNTPLFECLERLYRIESILNGLGWVTPDKDFITFEQVSQIRKKLKESKERELNFLKINIDEWLED